MSFYERTRTPLCLFRRVALPEGSLNYRRGIPLRPPSALGSAHRLPIGVCFAMAALGAGALLIEVNIRGWLGFAGSGVDLAVVTVWLTLAGLLSAWAFQRGDGWWPLLAAVGVILSVVLA